MTLTGQSVSALPVKCTRFEMCLTYRIRKAISRIIPLRRVRYERSFCRAVLWSARQFMTHNRHAPRYWAVASCGPTLRLRSSEAQNGYPLR